MDAEGNPIEVDDQKELLYADYVDTYQQQIDILEGDVESKRAEMEQVLQNKKFREEQEAAQAAEKAKQAEFDDMRAGLDDAKHEQDFAQAEVNRLQGEQQICESIAEQGEGSGEGSTTTPARRLLQEAPETTTTGGEGEGSGEEPATATGPTYDAEYCGQVAEDLENANAELEAWTMAFETSLETYNVIADDLQRQQEAAKQKALQVQRDDI